MLETPPVGVEEVEWAGPHEEEDEDGEGEEEETAELGAALPDEGFAVLVIAPMDVLVVGEETGRLDLRHS